MRCTAILATLLALVAALPARADQLILPQNRTAFYSDEPIELAVAGLARGRKAAVHLLPTEKSRYPSPVAVPVEGDGSTVTLVLPPGSLAPGTYTLLLEGKPEATITVRAGVNVSTLLLSQTTAEPKKGGANFLLGNAFSFGLLDGQGRPLRDVRGRRSAGMDVFDRAVKDDLPVIVYMYWTGYVTHKPFGSEKSWVEPHMIAATRLLSFHTAQRLRRFGRAVHSVGTLDEPGLGWGKTPAGGSGSGFASWDEAPWYEARAWKYTDDPASRADADWMKYMAVRCGIIREVDLQAKRDLKSVWPALVFSTDLYAPHAVMDGTEPLSQQINDVPASHVFLDWGTGRMGALSGVYLEKAHDPEAKLAHAMNGQLFGTPVPQPAQRSVYHLMRNSLLAAGLHSNWWLNPTGMNDADLATVNEPGQRLGPLFVQAAPRDHDVAVLWSFTEICMREKGITAREAHKKAGEQLKITIPSLAATSGAREATLEVNAYSIGGNYKDQVLGAHQALCRAGYPAHIVHERILPAGVLKKYKVLVVVGQTFELPADVRKAIADFVAAGAQVVVDRTTTVPFPGAVVSRADWRDVGFTWTSYFRRSEQKDPSFKNSREASYYQTNHFMDSRVRANVPATREALRATRARPALATESPHLAAEKHTAGEGALYLVINAYEKLPEIAPEKTYFIYNYAPYRADFTLRGIAPGSVAYCFEGADWKKVRALSDPAAPQTAEFEPGEMKVYLVARRRPGGLDVEARQEGSGLHVRARLRGLKMPWPLTVTVRGPADQELYHLYRATDSEGRYDESFPVGANAPSGTCTVRIESPAGPLAAEAKADYQDMPLTPQVIKERVRVFDEEVIRRFLAGKPEVVIAVAGDGQKAAAKLAAGLSEHGIRAAIKPEADVLRKVPYPRVWNPYAQVYRAAGPEKGTAGMAVKSQIRLGSAADGTVTARTTDGKDVRGDWRQPQSVVTIVGEGWVDYGGDKELCFEPGVKLYVDARRELHVMRGEVVEEKTTAAFRARWAKPWDALTTHAGAYQLPPELPEAYTAPGHLILLGDSTTGTAVAALQASELLPQVADAKYPGPGKALVSFSWGPFAVEKNVILVGAGDAEGVAAGVSRLLELAGGIK